MQRYIMAMALSIKSIVINSEQLKHMSTNSQGVRYKMRFFTPTLNVRHFFLMKPELKIHYSFTIALLFIYQKLSLASAQLHLQIIIWLCSD